MFDSESSIIIETTQAGGHDELATSVMEQNLRNLLNEKFGNQVAPEMTGGKSKKKVSKKSSKKKVSKKSSKKMTGGKKVSKKGSKKVSKKGSKKVSKKGSKKTSKKGSKKGSQTRRMKSVKRTIPVLSEKDVVVNTTVQDTELTGGKKKVSKKASREVNPYIKARSGLVKVLFAKAKSKGMKLTIPNSAKIIKKLEADVTEKYKLTDRIKILEKAIEHFNANVDKYLKD